MAHDCLLADDRATYVRMYVLSDRDRVLDLFSPVNKIVRDRILTRVA